MQVWTASCEYVWNHLAGSLISRSSATSNPPTPFSDTILSLACRPYCHLGIIYTDPYCDTSAIVFHETATTRHPLAPKKLLKTDWQQWHTVLLGNYLFQQIVTLLKECYVVWEEFISCVKGNRCRRERDRRTLRGCCDWSRALFWTALVFYFSDNVESLL